LFVALSNNIAEVKKMKRLLIFPVLLLLNIAVVQAQWEETNGPYGGFITSLVIIPNETGSKNVFACGGGNIFLSTNKGINWSLIRNGMNKYIGCLAVSPDGKMIAAGSEGAVYLSSDNGTSWLEVNNGLPNLATGCLAFGADEKGGMNIYAGMSSKNEGGETQPSKDSGVYYSNDMGVSWKNIGLKDLYFGIGTLLTVPYGTGGTDLYAVKGNFNNELCLYRTSNNGASWDSLMGVKDIISMAAGTNGTGGTNIYTGTYGFYISSDKGITWTAGGLTDTYVYSLYVNGPDVYAGTWNKGVYHSMDMGISWTEKNTGLLNTNVLSIAADDSVIYASTDGSGIFVSTNNGESWISRNQGLKKMGVKFFAVIGNNLYAGTSSNGVYISTNNGEIWSEVNNGLADRAVTALLLNPNDTGGQDIWAATERGISVSTNKGESWITPDNELKDGYILSLAVKGKTLLAGTAGGGVWLSTNYGTSWKPINKGLEHISMGGDAYVSVYAFAFSGNNFIAGTWGQGMYLSTNNGTSWSLIKLPINWPYTDIDIYSFMTIPNGTVGTNLLAATSKGILISTDDGVSWSFSNSGLPEQPGVMTFCMISNGKGGTDLIVDGYPNIYLSADCGKSWSAVGPVIPDTTHGVTSFAFKDNYLYAGTGNLGVIRCPLSDIITDIKSAEVMPSEFNLDQNYPNPFNPETTITYTLPNFGRVTIKVYDIMGREVKTLADKMQTAGTHPVVWEGKNMQGNVAASGIYFYTIIFNGKSYIKKMILMR
jgi:hypothetical protein